MRRVSLGGMSDKTASSEDEDNPSDYDDYDGQIAVII
ncbi:unnamed protein product [Anisakis simplex]|uniref:Uncharacterized protein n=1 Tax=Anisakis simplex TaxID=6269 RepID=A0A0M3JNE3_ANISI|nr:unnamed protein product [Anisakis simplex]